MLTVGSLFSGIGGLDLGLERAGMHVKWQSEIDPYACKVLAKHWPNIPNHGDIKQIDWRTVEPVDVICGGYPCQPFSTAGKRRGTDDPRHLWPWVRDAISALRPKYAILENVRGHLSLGGTTVIGELAEIGYDAEWRVVSAAGVGAPHRRDRIIIVAYPNSHNEPNVAKHDDTFRLVANTDCCDTPNGRQCANVSGQDRSGRDDRAGSKSDFRQIGLGGAGKNTRILANAHSERCQKSLRKGARVFAGNNVGRSGVECRPNDGWWEIEPNVGRVADGVSSRLDRLRGLGNAVVPQVAEYIGRLVMAAEYDA